MIFSKKNTYTTYIPNSLGTISMFTTGNTTTLWG